MDMVKRLWSPQQGLEEDKWLTPGLDGPMISAVV